MLKLDGGFYQELIILLTLGFTKAPFWLDDAYMVNDMFVWNTATICRYGILAFGSMIGFLIGVYRGVYKCCTILRYTIQAFCKNTFTPLNSISYHDINTGIRILQSNKCWTVLFLWSRMQTELYSQPPVSHKCMSTKWLQWLVIGYCHTYITYFIGLPVSNNVSFLYRPPFKRNQRKYWTWLYNIITSQRVHDCHLRTN